MAVNVHKWAILIGLDFYVDNKRRLNGAVNDVEDIKLYLQKNHPTVHITRLVAVDGRDAAQQEPHGPEASWPTYDNVIKALTEAKDAAMPGDFIYVHYSGHGTLAPTRGKSYQEDLGRDAALVLFDRNSEKGVRYLHGIELADLLDRITAKGVKLTVVLDCCHSGGISRQDKLVYRGMPWDDDVAIAYPPDLDQNSSAPAEGGWRDASTRKHWLLRPKNYVLLAACGPKEIAAECFGEDARHHGALSYFLFRALTMASSNRIEVALGAIHRHICAELHIPLPQQHPVLIGNEASIFLAAEKMRGSSRSGCNVTNVLGTGRIWIDVGYAHTVQVGDEYEVYPTALIEDFGTQIPTSYRIDTVHALHSEAEQSHPRGNGNKISVGSPAALSKPYRTKAQVILSFDSSSTLENALNNSAWLQLAQTVKTISSIPTFEILRTDSGSYTIYANGTEQLENLPDVYDSSPDAPQRLVYLLEHLAKFVTIQSLGIEKTGSLVEQHDGIEPKELDLWHGHESTPFSIRLQSEDDPQKSSREDYFYAYHGERVKCTVTNHTNNSLYLIVFGMTPLRRIVKLVPSSHDGSYKEIMSRGGGFRGHRSFKMDTLIPESLRKKGKRRTVDVLKFFVTTKPTHTLVDALQLPELSEAVFAGKRRSDSDISLVSLLGSLYGSGGSREECRGERSDVRGAWLCRNVHVHIEEKQ